MNNMYSMYVYLGLKMEMWVFFVGNYFIHLTKIGLKGAIEHSWKGNTFTSKWIVSKNAQIKRKILFSQHWRHSYY